MKSITASLIQAFYEFNVHYFRLPFPLRNHYYKGSKIDLRNGWYCHSCSDYFDLPNSLKNNRIKDINCPRCNSNEVHCSHEFAKARIDKRTKEEIDQYIIKMESIASSRKLSK